MDDLKARLRHWIEDNFIMGTGGRPLSDSDSFLEHHVLDSTGFLELTAHLEEAHGVRVTDEEMVPENLDSLDALASFIARKRG